MKPRKPRLSWRRINSFSAEVYFQLWRGTEHLATVSKGSGAGWYWYSFGANHRNTATNPVLRYQTAKDEAMAWIREHDLKETNA